MSLLSVYATYAKLAMIFNAGCMGYVWSHGHKQVCCFRPQDLDELYYVDYIHVHMSLGHVGLLYILRSTACALMA